MDQAYRDYSVRRAVGGHEIDVCVLMDAVYGVLRDMAGKYTDIAGIGVTGLHPHQMYSIAKIMWIKRNHREIYSKANRIHLMGDYVIWHLTGKIQVVVISHDQVAASCS